MMTHRRLSSQRQILSPSAADAPQGGPGAHFQFHRTFAPHVVLAIAIGLAAPACAVAEPPPSLSLPITCTIGATCYVQSYVDIDPGPTARDFSCGTATYEGHNGIDFRLHSAAQARDAVDVKAAADGVVKAVRDGVEDNLFPPRDPGRECGNGVVIDHGDGWETQYCHLKRNSIVVSRGDRVARGKALGLVGFSGLAEFAHLHFSVRHNSVIVDPFAPFAKPGECAPSAAGRGLWDAATADVLKYSPSQLIDIGFTDQQPEVSDFEKEHVRTSPTQTSTTLLLFARFINLQKDDKVAISIVGPNGFTVERITKPLEHSKATYIAFAGKRRRNESWQSGLYSARVELIRGDTRPIRRTTELILNP